MRFPAVNPFVGAAERAHATFDLPHQPEGSAGLFFAGAAASGAVSADFRQRLIEFGNGRATHELQALASSAAWAWILRIASAMGSMSVRGPRNMVCANHTASWQSRSFAGHWVRSAQFFNVSGG